MHFNLKATNEVYETVKRPNKNIVYFKNNIKSGNKQI